MGPSIVELTTTTIIVPSEFEMRLDINGNFIMVDTGSAMKIFNSKLHPQRIIKEGF